MTLPRELQLEFDASHRYWQVRFQAMGCPCDALIDCEDPHTARTLAHLISAEAWRVEDKFSRYRRDNIIHQINTADGASVAVDPETAAILNYANSCYQLSDGMFDITSGVLRRAWRFTGDGAVPDKTQINSLLPLVGWSKVNWSDNQLQMPAGMEIDLGGIGKEYAVDRAALQAQQLNPAVPVLVNFGGDLVCRQPRSDGQPWQIGIENPLSPGNAVALLTLTQAGIATSGDTHRVVVANGKRYGHILNPRTGWPVEAAPRSITVQAGSCTDAGILATLAQLQGDGAEAFLQQQDVPHWCWR